MLNLSAVDENKDIATKEYADTKAPKTEAIKNITRSGTTFTATRCDNTTFTFTQQDNNSVTGVKGNSESSYRTGNVNLTAANVGAAPTSHASTGTAYGLGNASNYGHVKLSSVTNGTAGDSGGIAATPSAVKAAYDLADSSQYEANLKWGGKDFSAAYGCVDAAMVGALGANRFELLKAEGITIEYSRDGGTTWTDYGWTDAYKRDIFTSIPYGNAITVGKMASGETPTADWKVRVILSFPAAGLYTILNKFVFLITTNGAKNCTVTIDGTRKSDENTWVTFKSNVGIAGWSGWNVVNYPTGITTYSNNTSQISKLRFTFSIGGLTSGYSNALMIYNILGFGGVGWATPSNLAKHGHAYTWDTDENAIFKGIKNSPVYFDATSCPEISGTPTYLLGIDPYANGGRVRYKNVSNISVGSATSATNATNATNATKAKQLVPETIRPTSANTGATNTTALVHYLATSSMTTGKPMADGHIIECDWDNTGGWKGQLYIPNSSSNTSNHLQWRGQNGGTTWGNWITVLDTNSTINAATVGGHTVNSDVPANAVFTDTVTRVKGNSESSYRTGDVNLTAANIGAAPASHTHAASDITSGVLAEARGGTGASSFMTALNDNLLSWAEDYGAMWFEDDAIVIGGRLPSDYGGVISGGSTGQVLTKTSSGYEWQTPSSGSSRQTTYFATSSTTAATAAKVITLSGWTPTSGDILGVRFTYANTAATPTLKVNGTTKTIYVGSAAPNSTTNPLRWAANDMVYFQYDGTYFRYITKAPLKTTLYYDATGTTDAVTLSVTAANFNFMRIYFKKTSGQSQCSSVDVFSPNQKYANLTVFEPATTAMWFASRTVYINGTSITTYSSVSGQVSGSPSVGSNTEVAIYRVEAW